jgi:hypothetical protein
MTFLHAVMISLIASEVAFLLALYKVPPNG